MGLFQGELGAHQCRKCEHWGGEVANGNHAVCVRGPGDRVVAMPANERATGGDDEVTISTEAKSTDQTMMVAGAVKSRTS